MVHLVTLLAINLLALRAVAVLHLVLFAADDYLTRGERDVVNVTISEILAVGFFAAKMFYGRMVILPIGRGPLSWRGLADILQIDSSTSRTFCDFSFHGKTHAVDSLTAQSVKPSGN